MLTTLRLLREDLRQKALRYYDDDSARTLVKAALTDGGAAMVLYRMTQAARRHGLGVTEMVLARLTALVGGAVIGRGAEFGPGFVILHANGVVINGEVRGGANIFVEHQVTIGAERRRSPRLGNDIFIGAGAKIVGGVTIGDGARIGANAVVVHDVEPHTTVVGVPARPVARRHEPVS